MQAWAVKAPGYFAPLGSVGRAATGWLRCAVVCAALGARLFTEQGPRYRRGEMRVAADASGSGSEAETLPDRRSHMPGEKSVHPTAEVSPSASIGEGTRVWHHVQVRERAMIGANCILGKSAYIDVGVDIGNNVKIQNGVSVFHGARVEDGVFLGPGCMLLNDTFPRATTPEGSLKTDDDWVVGRVVVRAGASVGAGAIVLPDVEIGAWAMVGAGAVVTCDVPPHALVIGVPARIVGFVCKCGAHLVDEGGECRRCTACGRAYLAESGGLLAAPRAGGRKVQAAGDETFDPG